MPVTFRGAAFAAIFAACANRERGLVQNLILNHCEPLSADKPPLFVAVFCMDA